MAGENVLCIELLSESFAAPTLSTSRSGGGVKAAPVPSSGKGGKTKGVPVDAGSQSGDGATTASTSSSTLISNGTLYPTYMCAVH